MRWFIRYGAPRNRLQALFCWLCGFDVHYGEAPPWDVPAKVMADPKPEAEPKVELPEGPPPVKRLTPRIRQSSV